MVYKDDNIRRTKFSENQARRGMRGYVDKRIFLEKKGKKSLSVDRMVPGDHENLVRIADESARDRLQIFY